MALVGKYLQIKNTLNLFSYISEYALIFFLLWVKNKSKNFKIFGFGKIKTCSLQCMFKLRESFTFANDPPKNAFVSLREFFEFYPYARSAQIQLILVFCTAPKVCCAGIHNR